ncbi:hypothetical protein J7384_08735 [Endozoicomonas sp. G2_1]|uniref:hypothetical protein n=1 Tax=Endozoicomonas sp. G2_1 TaxID=2821091 RepID=UPI001ADA88C3|nr:hypothetical protein [Endozoicomonas sp. G2_1]MBO9490446.1 hypothetical protein [Endozoicomonas sp. G2_1]
MNITIRNRHWWLLGGVVTSILIFYFLYIEQTSANGKFLDLKAQWLAIGLFPMLVGMFKAGIISSFKGFGVEIESQLSKPVHDLKEFDPDIIQEMLGEEDIDSEHQTKGAEPIPSDAKVLTFRYRNRRAYNARAIKNQIEVMNNIKYFRIDSTAHKFLCLIPVSAVTINNTNEELTTFVESLHNRNTHIKFKEDSLGALLTTTTSKLNVMRYLHSNNLEEAPVIDNQGHFKGLIQTKDIAMQLAEAIIDADNIA